MSDRVAIMHDGRIDQLGTPRDVYKRPATEFVADFVGASNRIEATVVGTHDDGTYEAELDDVGRVRAAGVPGLQAGQRARAIVRPESVALAPRPSGAADGPPGEPDIAIAVTIADVAYLGHHVSYVAETSSGRQLSLSVSDHTRELSVGESCHVSCPSAAVWLVDCGA